VTRRIREWLADSDAMVGLIDVPDPARPPKIIALARSLATGGALALDELLRSCVTRVQVHADRVDIALDRAMTVQQLAGSPPQDPIGSGESESCDGAVIAISAAARLRRAGKEMRIAVDDAVAAPNPDPSLLRLLVRANIIREKLFADRSLTLEEIAKAEGVVSSYVTRLFRLTLLAPDIVSAILDGRQPPGLTVRRLMDDTRLPLDWQAQRRSLGFAPAD